MSSTRLVAPRRDGRVCAVFRSFYFRSLALVSDFGFRDSNLVAAVPRWAGALLLALSVAGCGATPDTGTPEELDVAGTVSQRVNDAVDTLKADAERQAEAQFRKVLDSLQTQLDEVGRKAATAGDETRDRMWEAMRTELTKTQEELRAQIASLKDNSGATREELAQGIAKALRDLSDAIGKAAMALQQESQTRTGPPVAERVPVPANPKAN